MPHRHPHSSVTPFLAERDGPLHLCSVPLLEVSRRVAASGTPERLTSQMAATRCPVDDFSIVDDPLTADKAKLRTTSANKFGIIISEIIMAMRHIMRDEHTAQVLPLEMEETTKPMSMRRVRTFVFHVSRRTQLMNELETSLLKHAF